ncbi:MAG: hypothetical protein ACK4MV_05200 [Beijerinckiaceae bacterium]
MSMLLANRMRTAAAAGLLMLPLGGCSEYLARRDSIAATNGDGVRQNVATHVIDPWPRQSHNRTITLSGERAIENTTATNEPPEKPKERSATTLSDSSK